MVTAPPEREEAEGLGKLTVSKSNKLIQASYSLTLTEQRLLLCCIGQVNPIRTAGAQRNLFRISVSDFKATFPDANAASLYAQLHEAVIRLYERSIKVKEGRKTTLVRWVQSVTYHDGEGWVELHFSEKIAPYLTLLGQKFTRFKIEQIAGLRSTYSLRIFEHLMQFQDTGWCEIDLTELKERLELPYERFTDIRRWVLDVACNEISQKSNLTVEWKSIKQGRAVARIRFEFKRDPQGKLDLSS
jgi:plasmid replication initiation protein